MVLTHAGVRTLELGLEKLLSVESSVGYRSLEDKNVEGKAHDGGLGYAVSEGSLKTLLGLFVILVKILWFWSAEVEELVEINKLPELLK